MKADRFHIVIAGGGTAGHLFPGLAVAHELSAMADSPRITFAGSGRAFEAKHVADAGFAYKSFPCAPAAQRVRNIWRFLKDNLTGYRAACRFLNRERPSVVVGLGGFASVPVVRAAVHLGIPLVLLEQNAYPGKVTRWIAPHADLICAAFEAARQHLASVCPVRVTGNPLRPGFPARSRISQSPSHRVRQLLVLGGSGGAHSLNEAVPRALYKLAQNGHKIVAIHQSGLAEVDTTRAIYQKLNVRAKVTPFLKNMAEVMEGSDLVICRAGGSTLSEIAASGLPAILIPYPRAADDHQRHNADVFQRANAAQVVCEDDCGIRLDVAIARALDDLMSDESKRAEMTSAMLRLARPDAAWHVAVMVYDMAHQRAARVTA